MFEVPGFVYSHMSDDQDQGRDHAVRQFRAVIIDGAHGAIEVIAADTAPIDGVAQMPGPNEAPEVIRIMKDGITFAVAGDAVDVGDMVATDDHGRFVPTLVPADAVGKALSVASAADEEIAVLLY